MAITTIPELPEQTSFPATDDLFVVIDISEPDASDQTKRIQAGKFYIFTAEQLAANVVIEEKILAGAVTAEKIGTQAVGITKMAGLGITGRPTSNSLIFFNPVTDRLEYLPYPALQWSGNTIVDKVQLTLLVASALEPLAVGDGKLYYPVPVGLNGYNVVWGTANVLTASSSGAPTFQVARGRRSSPTSAPTYYDIFSTKITIDVGEYSSTNALTPPVVNTSYRTLASDDLLRVDVDGAGTGTKGLIINLELAK